MRGRVRSCTCSHHISSHALIMPTSGSEHSPREADLHAHQAGRHSTVALRLTSSLDVQCQADEQAQHLTTSSQSEKALHGDLLVTAAAHAMGCQRLPRPSWQSSPTH